MAGRPSTTAGHARSTAARASVNQSSSEFQRLEQLLASDLLGHLKQEHEREIELLWEEQLMLREELTRIVELMQSEILPREKQMHDMIGKMQQAYEASTRQLHTQLTQNLKKGGLSTEQQQQKQQLVNPLQAMEKELDRMAQLLSHDIIKPDIQDWQQPSAYSRPYGGSDARPDVQSRQQRSDVARPGMQAWQQQTSPSQGLWSSSARGGGGQASDIKPPWIGSTSGTSPSFAANTMRTPSTYGASNIAASTYVASNTYGTSNIYGASGACGANGTYGGSSALGVSGGRSPRGRQF